MAEDNVTERTALVSKTDGQNEQVYINLGYGSRRSSTSSVAPTTREDQISVEDLQYRIQYAFLNPSYDVEADINVVIQNAEKKAIVVDQLLQTLNTTPLPIQKKLRISRLLHQENHFRRTTEKQKIEKRKDLQGYTRSWHIWEGSLSRLTAYFGSNVASYFRFVRTLVYLNCFIAVFMIGLLTLPEIISGNFKSDTKYGGHFGELSDSIMFYGAYTNDLKFTYNLPLGYMLTWLAVNLFCFVVIITTMIIRYKKSKLADVGGEYPFAWRTFCSWDHSVTSRAGVIDQRTALKTDIKEIVREERTVTDVECHTRYLLYVGRLVSNTIVLALLGGSGYLIYFVADQDNLLPDSSPKWARDLFSSYQLTAVVAGLKVLVPPIFEYLILLEGWHPRIATKLTLTRTTLFYFASLVVFVVSLYDVTDACYKLTNQIKKSVDIQEMPTFTKDSLSGAPRRDEEQIMAKQTPHTKLPTHKEELQQWSRIAPANRKKQLLETMADNSSCCWENEVGDEVFKVVLVDLGLFLLIGVLLHLSRAAIVKFCCCRRLGYSKFVVVSCVLDVIYGQGLIWLGLYFSPILALIGVIKLIIVFYFRYFVTTVAMVPPQQMFRASSTGNFYLAILLLNLFVSLFPMAYAVIELRPSPDCGPFKNYDHAYLLISDNIGDLPDWLDDVLKYIGTPAIMVPVLMFLIMATIYYKTRSSSNSNLVKKLRQQLRFERRVEKRKIFATGRAMSNTALNKAYGSQESLVSAGKTASKPRGAAPADDIIEEEENEI